MGKGKVGHRVSDYLREQRKDQILRAFFLLEGEAEGNASLFPNCTFCLVAVTGIEPGTQHPAPHRERVCWLHPQPFIDS